MKPILHDREQHQQNEHARLNGGGAHVDDANNGWLSGRYPNSSQDVHDGAIDSTTEGLNSSPTSHGADLGPPLVSEPSALVTVIGGDAYATGTNTDATGAVSNTRQGFRVRYGGIRPCSRLRRPVPPRMGSERLADTFLSVAGADIVIKFELDLNFHFGNQDVAVSKLAYFAIDIDNWTPPNGPLVMDFQTHAIGQFGVHDGHLPSQVAPSGNLASVSAIADAQGFEFIGVHFDPVTCS